MQLPTEKDNLFVVVRDLEGKITNISGGFDDTKVRCVMRLLALILMLFVVVINIGERRSNRFFDSLSAEQHLITTNECRMCWLRRSELAGLDLRSAVLEGAELSGTDLNSTNLQGANLRFVRMRRADLTTVASLMGADLSYADLTESNIPHAVLKTAVLCNTILPNGEVSRCW